MLQLPCTLWSKHGLLHALTPRPPPAHLPQRAFLFAAKAGHPLPQPPAPRYVSPTRVYPPVAVARGCLRALSSWLKLVVEPPKRSFNSLPWHVTAEQALGEQAAAPGGRTAACVLPRGLVLPPARPRAACIARCEQPACPADECHGSFPVALQTREPTAPARHPPGDLPEPVKERPNAYAAATAAAAKLPLDPRAGWGRAKALSAYVAYLTAPERYPGQGCVRALAWQRMHAAK